MTVTSWHVCAYIALWLCIRPNLGIRYKQRNIVERALPSIDARTIKELKLGMHLLPVTLTHFIELRDTNAWQRSAFESSGIFGNMTVPANIGDKALSKTILQSHYWRHSDELITIDNLFRNNHPTGAIHFDMTEPNGRKLMDALKVRNGDSFTQLPFTLAQEKFKVHGAISLSQRGQYYPMHTHCSAMFVQVTGRKGWIFGNPSTVPRLSSIYASQENVLTQEEICGSFLGPKGDGQNFELYRQRLQAKFPEGQFSFVETHGGEAIYWPGLCDDGGTCGWWHATCALDDWNVGFNYLGEKVEDRDYSLLDPAEFTEVFGRFHDS